LNFIGANSNSRNNVKMEEGQLKLRLKARLDSCLSLLMTNKLKFEMALE
jgi:hypothetical protein